VVGWGMVEVICAETPMTARPTTVAMRVFILPALSCC